MAHPNIAYGLCIFSCVFKHPGRMAARHLLARWFAEPISSTLKMEAISSSETSGATQRTTRRHIPEDDTLHNHRCENLKSYSRQLRIHRRILRSEALENYLNYITVRM
jgi:hypothetical protein